MSVRAYHIKKIDYEHNDTFNFWHDDLVMNCLPTPRYLNDDGCGITEFSEDDIKEAIKRLPIEAKRKKTDGTKYDKKEITYSKGVLKKMLAQTKADGGYAQYYCF